MEAISHLAIFLSTFQAYLKKVLSHTTLTLRILFKPYLIIQGALRFN